jgi:hypothetical protein
MPVIPATQEVEIRRTVVQGQPREKVSETPTSTKQARHGGAACPHSYTQKAVGKRIVI